MSRPPITNDQRRETAKDAGERHLPRLLKESNFHENHHGSIKAWWDWDHSKDKHIGLLKDIEKDETVPPEQHSPELAKRWLAKKSRPDHFFKGFKKDAAQQPGATVAGPSRDAPAAPAAPERAGSAVAGPSGHGPAARQHAEPAVARSSRDAPVTREVEPGAEGEPQQVRSQQQTNRNKSVDDYYNRFHILRSLNSPDKQGPAIARHNFESQMKDPTEAGRVAFQNYLQDRLNISTQPKSVKGKGRVSPLQVWWKEGYQPASHADDRLWNNAAAIKQWCEDLKRRKSENPEDRKEYGIVD
ncbi:MAG: hypothetical protein Q9162_006034 [Coniocarpon cinnabarinum]